MEKSMEKSMEKIKQGKSKTIYEKDGDYIMKFRDDITAFDGGKHDVIGDKGFYCCQISTILFKYLEENGIKTHFIGLASGKEMIVKKLDMIPVEAVVRNLSTGSLTKNYGVPKGKRLKRPLISFYYKSDELHDPMLNEDVIYELDLCKEEELKEMRSLSIKINDKLLEFFNAIGLELVDFKLEFGRDGEKIVLGDELSPDSFRLWKDGESLDKDVYRKGKDEVRVRVSETYKSVYEFCRK